MATMPGFITHYICGQAALHAAPLEAQEMIKPYQQLFNIGTQGPDIFFYYIPGFLKKNMRHVGIEMHKHHFGAFMQSITDILLAETLPESSRAPIFAYICGYLTHYALDATAHPYVYFKTGTRQKGDKARAIKYSVNHRKFETAIDVLMLDLMSSEKPADYKLWQLIKSDSESAQIAAGAISEALYEAYDRNISPREVQKAMMYMVNITRVLQSRTGRRKRLMELMENLTVGEHLVSSIIHMQNVTDGVDYMNIEKNLWHFPGHDELEKSDSFIEMYHEAVNESTDMITALCQYMHDEISREQLTAIMGDRSLSTGLGADGLMPGTVATSAFSAAH